ncbi:MAG: hypothetical protein SGBAC_009399 [Bacillariaceae sp.]
MEDSRLGGYGDSALYFNNKMYFARTEDGHLWQTDGTKNGTKLVKELREQREQPPSTYNPGEAPRNFFMCKGELYFKAEDGIWKTDGTTEGTLLVEEFGTKIYFWHHVKCVKDQYLLLNGNLAGEDSLFFNSVLISTGEADSTSTLLMDNLGPSFGFPYLLRSVSDDILGAVPVLNDNNAIFYAGNDGIWSTQGTPDTTQKIFPMWVDTVIESGNDGKAFFVGSSPTRFGYTDGTKQGSSLLNITNPAGFEHLVEYGIPGREVTGSWEQQTFSIFKSQVFHSFLPLPAFNRDLLILRDVNVYSLILVATDGTSSGTKMIKELKRFEMLWVLALPDGRGLFRSAREIWVTDGTTDGTLPLAKFGEDTDFAMGHLFLMDDGSVVFDTSNGDYEISFWRIDVTGNLNDSPVQCESSPPESSPPETSPPDTSPPDTSPPDTGNLNDSPVHCEPSPPDTSTADRAVSIWAFIVPLCLVALKLASGK